MRDRSPDGETPQLFDRRWKQWGIGHAKGKLPSEISW